MRHPRLLATLAAVLLVGPSLSGQALLPVDAAPDLFDLPQLPDLASVSVHGLLSLDRAPVGAPPAAAGVSAIKPASSLVGVVPPALTGTGFGELIHAQVPSGGTKGDPRPLVVAYHGFGATAASVAAASTLDEEADARGWYYLSVTGLADKLFGTPPAQQNMDAAIRWMLDNFPIDPERIYLVGFSMGAGAVVNYAARHRDPDGVVPAAVATVSGSFDWTLTWELDPGLRPWLLHPYNFGGTPTEQPFAYLAASALRHQIGPWGPWPALVDPGLSMASNLASVPLYITWDTDDPLTSLAKQSEHLAQFVSGLGGQVTTRPRQDTLDPLTGQPAPHSWAVLDEAELFDMFAQARATRTPGRVHLLAGESLGASFLAAEQTHAGAFTRLEAEVDVQGNTLAVGGVENLARLTLSLDDTGLDPASPVRVSAEGGDAGYRLHLLHAQEPPGYLTTTDGLHFIDGVDATWDGALTVDVPPSQTFEALVHHPGWYARLDVQPDPAPWGGDFEIIIDTAPGSPLAWLILSPFQAALALGPGRVLGVSLYPPVVILPVPLDEHGDLSLGATLPPAPAGVDWARLFFQVVTPRVGDQPGQFTNVSFLDVG